MLPESAGTLGSAGYCFLTLTEVMIIVAQGFEYIKDGIVVFAGSEEIPCPICGERLSVHGTCLRKLRTQSGTRKYRLRVMECRSCGRTHRELPREMVPYKRMSVSRIAAIAQAKPQEHLEVAETSVWRRVSAWMDWFLWYARKILEGLSVSNEYPLTNKVGGTIADRLAYFVRLVVNSGNWIQHRSAQIFF